MDPQTAIALGRHTLLVALTVAVPVLGVGLVVGLISALFQALTSLQEQTLAMVPKILAVAGALFYLLPWILRQITDYCHQLYSHLAEYGGAL